MVSTFVTIIFSESTSVTGRLLSSSSLLFKRKLPLVNFLIINESSIGSLKKTVLVLRVS